MERGRSLKGKTKIVRVSTLESTNRSMECEAVKLRVKGSSGTSSKEIDGEFLTRPSLNISAMNMATEEDISRYQHLSGIDLPMTREKQVTILLFDVIWLNSNFCITKHLISHYFFIASLFSIPSDMKLPTYMKTKWNFRLV